MLSVAGEFVAIGQVVAEHQQWIGGLGQRPRCNTGHTLYWLLLTRDGRKRVVGYGRLRRAKAWCNAGGIPFQHKIVKAGLQTPA